MHPLVNGDFGRFWTICGRLLRRLSRFRRVRSGGARSRFALLLAVGATVQRF